MIETLRLKNVAIFFLNNFKFCAVKKNLKAFDQYMTIRE